jgi:hypothetical protein
MFNFEESAGLIKNIDLSKILKKKKSSTLNDEGHTNRNMRPSTLVRRTEKDDKRLYLLEKLLGNSKEANEMKDQYL